MSRRWRTLRILDRHARPVGARTRSIPRGSCSATARDVRIARPTRMDTSKSAMERGTCRACPGRSTACQEEIGIAPSVHVTGSPSPPGLCGRSNWTAQLGMSSCLTCTPYHWRLALLFWRTQSHSRSKNQQQQQQHLLSIPVSVGE